MRTKHRSRSRRGFTLIELLLVLVILAILASMGTIFARRMRQTAFNRAARAQIGMFEQAIKAYEMDMRSYPSDSVGLDALITVPGDGEDATNWAGPYLEKTQIPLDPWGNQYVYRTNGPDQFIISSWGADEQDQTEDDITNE
jgi:general secretion pathway protein G